MVNRVINSFGTITLPKHMRDELGIVGTMSLSIDVREDTMGTKEIVIRKTATMNDIVKRYINMAEIISRISEYTVSIVWDGAILSMTSNSTTQYFFEKLQVIDKCFSDLLKNDGVHNSIVDNPNISFLPNNVGVIKAYFKIPHTGGDHGYFVVLDSKYNPGVGKEKITKEELERRYEIIADIISMEYEK